MILAAGAVAPWMNQASHCHALFPWQAGRDHPRCLLAEVFAVRVETLFELRREHDGER